MKRNEHFSKLVAGYLFPEIEKRKKAFQAQHPDARLISLGIGNTTEAITENIGKGLQEAVRRMQTQEGYRGYGAEQGMDELRQAIAEKIYSGRVQANDVFISDGAKCDIGRLQILFGAEATIAVQDPVYPVYVDSGVMLGQTGAAIGESSRFAGIRYLPCTPENAFFPDLEAARGAQVLFFCSPNNPTGAAATREQLEQLVAFAKQERMIVVFDAAYSSFIREPHLPRSIYEIPGAKEVAIEVQSFSKCAGFTGLRLGWTVLPEELRYDDGFPVRNDWNRVMTTLFNGASNVIQHGGLAALSDSGRQEMQDLVNHYMGNADLLARLLARHALPFAGGKNAPYLWVHFPGRKSWDVFDNILQDAHVVCTPGAGFGAAGESFVRLSAFGGRQSVEEACTRLDEVLPKLL